MRLTSNFCTVAGNIKDLTGQLATCAHFISEGVVRKHNEVFRLGYNAGFCVGREIDMWVTLLID